MNKILSIVLMCLFALQPTTATGGMSVTDAIAHMFQSEQVTKLAEQYKLLTDQLNTLKEDYEEALKHTEQFTEQIQWAEDTFNQITGTYQNAMGVLDDLKNLQQELASFPSGLQEQASKWAGLGEMEQSFDGVEQLLASTFPDARSGTFEDEFRQNQQFQLKQQALKRAIQSAETAMGEVPEDLETLVKLSEKIDATENIKDALDLNNRFLAEIATILNKMLLVQTAYFEADSLIRYRGIDEATMAESEARVKRERTYDPLESSRVLTKRARAAGVDPFSDSDEDIARMFQRN